MGNSLFFALSSVFFQSKVAMVTFGNSPRVPFHNVASILTQAMRRKKQRKKRSNKDMKQSRQKKT